MVSFLKRFLIGKLGGFYDFEEYVETLTDPKIKHEILTRAAKKLYNTIGAEDILKQHETGHVTFMGKSLSKGDIDLLVAEARQLESMRIWKVIEADAKYQANRKMFLLSRNEFDLIGGKIWILAIDAINQRLANLKSAVTNFSKNP